jgi:hypothetical protein
MVFYGRPKIKVLPLRWWQSTHLWCCEKKINKREENVWCVQFLSHFLLVGHGLFVSHNCHQKQ